MRPSLSGRGLAAGALALLAARSAAAQQTTIRGFADVTYSATDRRHDEAAFGLGQFDLYITSKLADRIGFLGETVFESDGGEFAVDVERVLVTFAPRDWLRVTAGKHHTPIGYWNNAYHHGALLQPTIARSDMYHFEDEGGMLPIHTVGLSVSGRDIGPAHLGYDVLVGNGIGATATTDNDPSKSVTAALSSQVTSELQLGASVYTDHIAAGTPSRHDDAAPLAAPVRQQVAGAYAAYLGSPWEVIAEAQAVRDRTIDGDAFTSRAGTLYAGYRRGRLVPYVRLDAMRMADADPYLAPANGGSALVGARWDFSAAATAKLELASRTQSGFARAAGLRAQVAIGF